MLSWKSTYVISMEVYVIFNFLFVSFEEESIVGVSIVVDSIMRGIRDKSLRIFFQNSFKTN